MLFRSFDFLYSEYTKQRFRYLSRNKKISEYESENIMNTLLKKILEEPEFSKYSFVFEMPLKDIVGTVAMSNLPTELKLYASSSWSHCDFVIFNRLTKEIKCCIEVDGYAFHKKGTKQAVSDEKKNKIFEFIGIPLLRLSTKGSNEEAQIRDVLKSI